MSSFPKISTITRAFRRMHTDGRHVNHPGPSAAPSSRPIHISSRVASAVSDPTPLPGGPAPLPEHKLYKSGKPKPHRPPRLIPVRLPNGDPTPTVYPPPPEYFDNLAVDKRKPHPLWNFFHLSVDQRTQLSDSAIFDRNMGSVEVLETDDRNLHSGRSWKASELRRKSFKDLHTLWYVLLRERNVLATQKEERRRLGIAMSNDNYLLNTRAARCRKSMARIKYVLNERRLGLIAAAGPHITGDKMHFPWSGSESTDPAGMTAAILGETEVPDILVARRRGTLAEKASVQEEDVAAGEIEARDEGFGGGEEAKEFVNDVEVTDEGKVEKKE